MPSWILIIMGVMVIAIVTIDVLWTTLSTHGAGPIASELTSALWLCFRAIHRRRRSHNLLKTNVVITLVLTFATWVLLFWVGWTLVFSASAESVLELATGEPAPLPDRIYYVGMILFTLGIGDFVAGSQGWRILTALASLNGLIMITLVITYLLPVVSAGVDRRQLALTIWGLGESSEQILLNSWDGKSFAQLENQLYELSTFLTLHAERHLAYPVLQYFHATDPRADLSPRIATLDDALTTLEHAVSPEVRPSRSVLRSLRQALDCHMRRVELHHVTAAEDAPPVPDFEVLREAGIPLLDDKTTIRAFGKRREERKLMHGFLRADGWSWGD